MYELRGRHRIVGSLVGALPSMRRQTQDMGMPVSLLFEEALLVVEEGIAEVVDGTNLQFSQRVAAAASADGVLAASVSTMPGAAVSERCGAASEAASTSKPAANSWYSIDTECAEWTTSDALQTLAPSQLRLAKGARLAHAAVFRALWSRGFFITCGSTFGADYLCYPGDPMRHHAHLLVHVSRPGRRLQGVELMCAARLANSVKKAAVLAECVGEGRVHFAPIEAETLPLSLPPPRGATRVGKRAAPPADTLDALADVKSFEDRMPRKSGMAREDAGAACTAGAGESSQPEDPGTTGLVHVVNEADKVLRAPVDHAPALPAPAPRARRARAPWEQKEGDDAT